MDGLLRFLDVMQQAGMPIPTVYDIGACKGRWSTELKTKALPQAQFFLFEANPAYDRDLAATGLRHFTTVLSNPGRDAVDFFNGTNTGDSYYKETTKYYDGQGSIRLNCTTLDKMVQEQALPIPTLMKLDTQGSELDILAGAEAIIDRVDLIYTECPIVRYNAGAPHIQDYLDYFSAHKFIPVSLLEAHRSENILLQIDIMFMRQEAKERYLGPNRYIRPWAA